MQLGVIGLGRMGGNIARRLTRAGHDIVVFDVDAKAVDKLAGEGMIGARGLEDIVKKLEAPRAVWVMLPSGKITEDTIATLSGLLDKGDIIIDGGNTFYKDDIRRSKALSEKGITYVDVGTSGGVWGLERGYCMMIGGEQKAVEHIDPILKALAPGIGSIERTRGREGRDAQAEDGYLHCGPAGSGHFVKMVHNGIEYGLMQAYAEGFDILKNKDSKDLPEDERFTLNLPDIAEVWRPRQRRVLVAARSFGDRPGAEREPLQLFRLGVRFRRRPLDDRGRDRGGCSGGSSFRRALRALPLSAGPYLRREAPVRDAFPVRRTRRAEVMRS